MSTQTYSGFDGGRQCSIQISSTLIGKTVCSISLIKFLSMLGLITQSNASFSILEPSHLVRLDKHPRLFELS